MKKLHLSDFFTAMSTIWITTWYSAKLVYRSWFRDREWLIMFLAAPVLMVVMIGLIFWSTYISFCYMLGTSKSLVIMSGRREFLKAIRRGDYEWNQNAKKEATCE